MPEDLNEIKRELANLSKQKEKRIVGCWPEDPPQWWVGEVIDPRSQRQKPFTCAGAWDFIAEELEKKETSIKPVYLISPRGELGYEFLVNTTHGVIYIKVRLGQDRIIGRSFHYSDRG
jgi:hypothetical protein